MSTADSSLRDRARELAPELAARAADNDQRREVHPDSVRAVVEAGLVRATLPRRWGGLEAPPEEFVGAVIEVSKACTSTGWVLMLLGVHNWELAHMSNQAQEDVYGRDPDALVSSSYAPHGKARRVEGGYVLSGQWKSSSGVTHASWAILGAALPDAHGNPMGNFLVDLSECEIIDDWFVLGMRGTASRSVRCENVFVPDHRILDRDMLLARLGPGLEENDGPLYRLPQGLLYTVVAGAPAIGAAWAFYAAFVEQMKKVVRRFDDVSLSQERVQLLRLNEVRTALAKQEENVLGLLDRGYRQAQAGEVPDDLALARGIYDMARVTTTCLGVAQTLFPTLSASVVHEKNPMQRLYRDLLTARQHFTQNTDFAGATAANLELGNDATAAFILTPERLEAARERAASGWGRSAPLPQPN